MPGAGRQAGPVVAITPNLSQTLPFQRDTGATELNTVTDKLMALPGSSELMHTGAGAVGLRNAEAIPTLPQSAVVTGEALRTMPGQVNVQAFSPQQAALLSPNVERFIPQTSETTVPAFKRVAKEIQEKTARLEAPLQAVSNTGAGAPSASELHRLGEEIWDLMGFRGQGGEKAPGSNRSGVDGADHFAGASGQGLSQAQTQLQPSSDATGSAPTVGMRLLGLTGSSDQQDGVATVRTRNSAELSSSVETQFSLEPSNPASPRGVALITMNVVGQSLILSDAGLAAEQARRAATAVSSSFGSSLAEGEQTSESNFSTSQLSVKARAARSSSALAETAADTALAYSLAGGATNAGATFVRAAKTRGFSVPRAADGPGAWSWAALLPLLLLGLAALPEYRS